MWWVAEAREANDSYISQESQIRSLVWLEVGSLGKGPFMPLQDGSGSL